MQKNLIETAQEYLSSTVVSKIADSVGLEPNTAQSLTEKIFPILLGGLGLQAQSGEGAQRIFDVVDKADPEFLDNLDDQLTGDNSQLIDQGKNTLTALLGDNFTSVTNAIGAIPGLSSGKTGGLIGLLTPVLTGLLKKQQSAGGLDASGLAALIGEQKSFIGASLGGDFLNKIGLGSLASFAGAATGAASGIASSAMGTASDAANTVGNAIGGAADAAGSAVSGTASSIGGAAASVGQGAANIAGDAAEGTVDAAKAVGGAIGSGIGAAKDGAAELTEDVAAAASGAAKAVGGAASAMGAGAANLAGDAADVATATTQKAGNGLMKILPVLLIGLLALLGFKMCGKSSDSTTTATNSESSEGILGSIKEGATDLGNKAADTAANAASAVSDGVGDAANATGDALGNLKDGAADLGSKAMDSAGDAASAVSGGVKDAAGATGDALGNIKDGAADLGNKAMNSASDAAGATGDALNSLKDGAMNLGKKTMDSAENGTSTIAQGTKAATGTAVKMIDDLTNSSTPADIAETTTRRSFIPESENGAPKIELSEKASSLAHSLSQIQVTNDSDLDNLYATMGSDSDSKFLYRIPFATGETGVPSSHQAALIAKLKEASKDATLVTIGYADVRGDDALNKRLSYGRAREVGDWIKGSLGQSTNIESFSMGETDRFSKEDFSKNRVVEVWQIK